MNVLIIFPKCKFSYRVPSAPLGALSIASYVQAKGHTARVYDRAVENVKLDAVISEFKPDIVGLSGVASFLYKDAVKVSRRFKKSGVPVIWGGTLVSALAKETLDTGCVDFVAIGEGEETFLELIEVYEKHRSVEPKSLYENVKGIAYLDNGRAHFTEDRPFLDLAALPPIDWTLIDVKKYFQHQIQCDKMLYLYASKGCPFNCRYCFSPKFNRRVNRTRPIEQVLDEIELLVRDYGLNGVYFADEMFCVKHEDMLEFCRGIASRSLKIVWGCQTRSNALDRETLQMMYDSGCRWILFGLESGSPETLAFVNKKNILGAELQEVFQNCSDIGITTLASMIMGFPHETAKQLRESIDLCFSIKANLYPFNYFTVLPGTELCDYAAKELGFKPPETFKGWLRHLSGMPDKLRLNFSSIPKKELRVVYNYFYWASFISKKASAEKPFEVIKVIVSNTLKNIFQHGFLHFLVGSATAAVKFFTVMGNVFLHPVIRKKYGLYGLEKRDD